MVVKMILVLIKAFPLDNESLNEIIEFSKELIEKSRQEYGNIHYNLYLNKEDNTLLLVGEWKSKELLVNHLKTDYFIEFEENIDELLSNDLIISVYDSKALNFNSLNIFKSLNF